MKKTSCGHGAVKGKKEPHELWFEAWNQVRSKENAALIIAASRASTQRDKKRQLLLRICTELICMTTNEKHRPSQKRKHTHNINVGQVWRLKIQ